MQRLPEKPEGCCPNSLTIRTLEVRSVVEAPVYVGLLLEVEECNLVLKVTDFVANRNAISRSENGVREDFVEEGDFIEHFCFSHISNLAKFFGKVKFF